MDVWGGTPMLIVRSTFCIYFNRFFLLKFLKQPACRSPKTSKQHAENKIDVYPMKKMNDTRLFMMYTIKMCLFFRIQAYFPSTIGSKIELKSVDFPSSPTNNEKP